MIFLIWCMFHHLLVTLLSTFFVQTEIYISWSILVELHKWYPDYSWAFQELHNQPWCCSILLQLMKKKLCGFRFLMEMEPGLEPFSKFFLKKKLLAHGTLLHFRWTAPKGPMNWIIHVGDWKSQLQHPSLSTPGLHPCDARYTSFATCSTLVSLIKWSNNTVKIERVSSLSFHFQCR